MKKQGIVVLLAAATLVVSVAMKKGSAKPDKYAETITANDLRMHLTILASDEYEGRETGEKGQKMAADYIASHFNRIGIPAQADGSWYQQVKLVKLSGGTSEIAVNYAAKTGSRIILKSPADYFYFATTPGMNIVADELYFAGYGIDDPKYSDYAARDSAFYKDKVLVILDGEPMSNGTYTISGDAKAGKWTKQPRAKLETARRYQAKALIIIPADYEGSRKQADHRITSYALRLDAPTLEDPAPPTFYMNAVAMDSILKGAGEKRNVAALRKEINSSGKPVSFVINTEASISVTRKEEKIVTENVLGFVEGTDLKNEIIVVTAHYDHLGKHDGVVYNGADDDGSGTVAVMELAEAFMKAKQDGNGPRRSMLFMTVSGEEKGLLGSAWYTRFPVYPLEKTMCDLNIDMIGRADEEHRSDSNFVYVIGADRISPDLKKSIESVNKKYTQLKLDYRYDDENDPNMFYYRSDHYNFAKNGIPVAFFFNGVHADYHKETDEVSKINFNLMQKRTRLVFYTAWDLANRNKPLARKAVKK